MKGILTLSLIHICQVVARLLEGLDGHGTGKHQVHHDDCDPAIKVEVDGELHADVYKRQHVTSRSMLSLPNAPERWQSG